MGNLNSSGAQDRFVLASGGTRVWHTQQGGNQLDINVKGDDQSAASVTVTVSTSEDNATFTQVGSTITVVPSGVTSASYLVGKYAKIASTSGQDQVLLVVKLRNIADVIPSL